MTNIDDKIDDFFVVSSFSDTPSDFFELYEKLKASSTDDLINERKLPEESAEGFLTRLTLSSLSQRGALFRKKLTADEVLPSLWVSLVKEKAMRVAFEHHFSKFAGLDFDAVRNIAKRSVNPSFISELPGFLAREYGVILVVEKYIPTSKVDGCSFKLVDGTPVVGISIRFNRYDNFWFTLIHELAHVVLHYDQLDKPIVDNLDSPSDEEVELEANRLAKDSLVPRSIFRKALIEFESNKSLKRLSEQAETHPSILAGLLRHAKSDWRKYSREVNFMDVRAEFNIYD